MTKCQNSLNLYASHGLRTLCLTRRVLTQAEYENWRTKHALIELSIDDREQMLFESACEIEVNLELLGVTGIEDRLQDGVPECIAALREAGMNVWVLTGDKIETAVNIAYAAQLFSTNTRLIQITTNDVKSLQELLQHHLHELLYEKKNIGLVIDGRTLAFCQEEIEKRSQEGNFEEKFIELIKRCNSVLCCRATPIQKVS